MFEIIGSYRNGDDQMEALMNANYGSLSVANRYLIDEMIDFLITKQKKNETETLEAIHDAEIGKTIGPFNSIAELTEALDAED